MINLDRPSKIKDITQTTLFYGIDTEIEYNNNVRLHTLKCKSLDIETIKKRLENYIKRYNIDKCMIVIDYDYKLIMVYSYDLPQNIKQFEKGI